MALNPYLFGVFLNLIRSGGGKFAPPREKLFIELRFSISRVFWNPYLKWIWVCVLTFLKFSTETDVKRSNVSEIHSFFFQNDIFGKLALLSPILALEFFPLAEFLQIWPWMKYISFFAKYCFLWIFFDKSDFWTFGFSLLSFDKSSVETPPYIFFSFFLRSYEQKRKKRKVKKIPAIFFEK